MNTSPKVRVQLLPSGVALRVGAGERVLDALDEHARGGLPTACRAANCGICLVEVCAGAATLGPAQAPELRRLKRLDAGPDRRLGCQVVVRPGAAAEESVILRVINAPPRSLGMP